MTDPARLLDSSDATTRRLLESASADRPGSTAARATLVALGLTAPAVATAAAATPAGAALAKGTIAGVLGSITAKVAIAVSVAAVAGSAVVVTTASHRPVSSLAQESVLLRSAADALEAHHPDAALAALKAHDTRYPQGLLAEEAAALNVEALDQSGDRDGAQAALSRFHARYPDSPFAPVINSPSAGDESLQAEQGDSK
jgi:hypothetical protein